MPISNVQLIVVVDLKDPILNLEVSKGILGWTLPTFARSYEISWDGRHIYSVVQGADGYAAFHYIMFFSALSANVEVTYFRNNCPGGLTTNVNGVILARYGGHDYSTDYDKKYYQSRLFNRPHKNAEELKTNSIIPLSKSVVVVPVDSSLIVEAKLRVSCNGSTDEEVVFGVVEFMVDESGEMCETIRGSTCSIQVSILKHVGNVGFQGRVVLYILG